MKTKDLYNEGMIEENMETIFTKVLGNYPLIRVLDYLIIGKDFDYSISDIVENAGAV